MARILLAKGIPVLDADQLARQAVAPGSEILAQIVARFGPEIVQADGSLDRRSLGSKVFADPEQRTWLEGLIHPYVRQQMQAGIQHWQMQGIRVGCLMIPLLFEAGLESWVDQIWVVTCTPKQQRQRIRGRDQLSDPEIDHRLAAQWPLAEKCARASLVLDNSGDPVELEQQVTQALRSLI